MKYVVGIDSLGHRIPVVFPDAVAHVFVVALLKAHRCADFTAGFVNLVDEDWVVSEEISESTGLGPGDEDHLILNAFLKTGASGLELENVLAFIALRSGAFHSEG